MTKVKALASFMFMKTGENIIIMTEALSVAK